MPYSSLADFLKELDACGQLARVEIEVDGELELAEITRRVAAAEGPALLFERVAGRSMAVVTNLLGTEDRVRRALSLESLDELMSRTESLVQKFTPQNWFERLRTGTDDSGAAKFRPKLVKSGLCQQVVRLGSDVDLRALPFARHWPAESAASITAGRVITALPGEHPQPGVTLCPLAVLDQNRLAVIADANSAFTVHWGAYRAAIERMPVAVVLGGDPAAVVAASLDLPHDVETDHMTGLLRCQAMELVKCRTHTLVVPAEAELVIEGYLDPESEFTRVSVAGAGGSHLRCEPGSPVIHVTAVTHRTHAIVPSIVDCGTRGENAALAKAREQMLLAAAQIAAPSITRLRLPAYGAPDRYAFVAIRKTTPHEARQVATALWGVAPVRNCKFLVVVDEHVDVYDTTQVLAEIGANVVPGRDLFSYDGPPCPWSEAGTGPTRHLGIDATAKLVGEASQDSLARLTADNQTLARVNDRWSEYHIELADLASAVKFATAGRLSL